MVIIFNKDLNLYPNFTIRDYLLLKSKHAQGHVEMILSTIFFLGFLMFILIYMNPFTVIKKDISIDPIRNAILNEIQSDIGILSVIVNSPDDCYDLSEINLIYGDNFTEGEVFDRKFTIYYGSFFDPNIVGEGSITCLSRPNRDFTFGGYIEDEIIVYEKVQNFKKSYESNYESLKNSLNIGDFEFKFKDFDNKEIAELSVKGSIPENVNVFSRENPVRVMDKNAEIHEYIFEIKVW
jgi:hypothetical protein